MTAMRAIEATAGYEDECSLLFYHGKTYYILLDLGFHTDES
jgi:hypothetical protein